MIDEEPYELQKTKSEWKWCFEFYRKYRMGSGWCMEFREYLAVEKKCPIRRGEAINDIHAFARNPPPRPNIYPPFPHSCHQQ